MVEVASLQPLPPAVPLLRVRAQGFTSRGLRVSFCKMGEKSSQPHLPVRVAVSVNETMGRS